MQRPLHATWLPMQVSPQLPLLQTVPPVHTMPPLPKPTPQPPVAPQWLGSLAGSMQRPAHATWLDPHEYSQCIALQTWLVPQAAPTEPDPAPQPAVAPQYAG